MNSLSPASPRPGAILPLSPLWETSWGSTSAVQTSKSGNSFRSACRPGSATMTVMSLMLDTMAQCQYTSYRMNGDVLAMPHSKSMPTAEMAVWPVASMGSRMKATSGLVCSPSLL